MAFCHGLQFRRFRLRQVNDAPVIAEIQRHQAPAAGPGPGPGSPGARNAAPGNPSGKNCRAPVRPAHGTPRCRQKTRSSARPESAPRRCLQGLVQQPAGTAIGVGDEDLRVTIPAPARSWSAQRPESVPAVLCSSAGRHWNSTWPQPFSLANPNQFACDGAARDDQDGRSHFSAASRSGGRQQQLLGGLNRSGRIAAIGVGADGLAEFFVQRRTADHHDVVVTDAPSPSSCR